jgi:predicted TPR repeat methyltransferase
MPTTNELEQARELFFQGIEHFEAGRLEPARERFEASLALAPGRPSALVNLGITLHRLGRCAEAITPLEQAATAEPGQADAWVFLGLANEALDRWQPAADALARALELTPEAARLWLAYGRCRLRLDAVDTAMQAFERATEADPALAEAWSERGSLLRELHRLDDAARCFEKALALGTDAELHGYYLASVRGSSTPAATPRRYVETLFDQYAGDFQEHLVDKLGYRGHETLLKPLIAADRRYRAVLDLGCGSGLCGSMIRPLADAIDGVDVSAAMLNEARKLDVYRHLTHADLVPFLADNHDRFDLVLAADVFIYIGDLSAVFESVRRILATDGCFAFTLEQGSDDEDVRLLPSLRYRHSESHVRRLAREYGFAIRQLLAAPLRHEQSQPVTGLYVFLEHVADR